MQLELCRVLQCRPYFSCGVPLHRFGPTGCKLFTAVIIQWPSGIGFFEHTPDHQLQKYHWLTKVFGALTTQVMSFDYLLDMKQSLQSYVISNATLGRVRASWTQCDLLVNSKEMEVVNLGLDWSTMDVVRLAGNMHNQHNVTNDTQYKFKLVPSNPQIESVVRWLPKEYFTLEKLHWRTCIYNLTGINRPSERDKKCINRPR